MRPRWILALGNFFGNAHFYLIVYVITPYLATFMPQDTVGLAVALGAIVTLITFPFLPRLVARHGPQRLAITFACIEGLVLLLLSLSPQPSIAIWLVALSCAASPLIVFQLDLLLEACVEDERTTGRIRTAFITAGNTALILAPLLVGFLLGNSDHYHVVFLAAALSIIPFVLLMLMRSLPHIRAPQLTGIRQVIMRIMNDSDLRAIAICNAVLQFFFHLVPLYIPLYLHLILGIPWSNLGWILTVSLIPFVILEYPAGWLADTHLGDRVLLATGFVIAGLSFAGLAGVTVHTHLGYIIAILILIRVGGSLIEAMTEAHFFRRVSSEDAEAVSVFRMMRPFGALTAPIVGSILLTTGSYAGLFSVSGFAILGMGLAIVSLLRAR